MKANRPRMPPTAPEENRLRELYRTRFSDELEDVENALCAILHNLLFSGNERAADLAAALYKLACRTWHRNRDEYGHANTAHPDERQMCRAHGELLEAIARAELIADGPELLNPWAELGAAWQAFEAEQKGGA